MLRLDLLQARAPARDPFPHLTAQDLLPASQQASLAHDFPDPGKPGFFPVEQLDCGPIFDALVEDLRGPEFSRIVGEKLGRDLVNRPQMIVARKWSAARDGRPHTDGLDKVATALLYLNDHWRSEEGGALRFLASADVGGPGSAPISPVYGSFAAFARADDSWHGHAPFTGERRVVQVFWLVDQAAAGRKTRRHRRADLFKRLGALVGRG